MLRIPQIRAWLLTLMCVVLLLGPVGGAHLHLCFDGKEPPASFHLFDLGLHHSKPGHSEPGMNAPHEDSDVAVSDNLLSKGKFEWTPTLALLAATLLLSLLRTPQRFIPLFTARATPPAPLFLRPPLRGPPLLTSR
jgi:hypothetical protein